MLPPPTINNMKNAIIAKKYIKKSFFFIFFCSNVAYTIKTKIMTKGIAITKALAGYTRISYNGEEIAKHYLSATTQGTREAFEIPEEESVISWLENNFADEIKAIDAAQEEGEENA